MTTLSASRCRCQSPSVVFVTPVSIGDERVAECTDDFGHGLSRRCWRPSGWPRRPRRGVLSPFDAVDQFIGTEMDTTQNKSNDAYGNTFPGAAVPFGMVQPSPTTYRAGNPLV